MLLLLLLLYCFRFDALFKLQVLSLCFIVFVFFNKNFHFVINVHNDVDSGGEMLLKSMVKGCSRLYSQIQR